MFSADLCQPATSYQRWQFCHWLYKHQQIHLCLWNCTPLLQNRQLGHISVATDRIPSLFCGTRYKNINPLPTSDGAEKLDSLLRVFCPTLGDWMLPLEVLPGDMAVLLNLDSFGVDDWLGVISDGLYNIIEIGLSLNSFITADQTIKGCLRY